MEMVSEYGGVEAARHLLRADTPSEGFVTLWSDPGRVDGVPGSAQRLWPVPVRPRAGVGVAMRCRTAQTGRGVHPDPSVCEP